MKTILMAMLTLTIINSLLLRKRLSLAEEVNGQCRETISYVTEAFRKSNEILNKMPISDQLKKIDILKKEVPVWDLNGKGFYEKSK